MSVTLESLMQILTVPNIMSVDILPVVPVVRVLSECEI